MPYRSVSLIVRTDIFERAPISAKVLSPRQIRSSEPAATQVSVMGRQCVLCWRRRDLTRERSRELERATRPARSHGFFARTVPTVLVAKVELDSGLRTSALAFCQCKIYRLRRRQLVILGRITYFLASFRRYCSKNEQ